MDALNMLLLRSCGQELGVAAKVYGQADTFLFWKNDLPFTTVKTEFMNFAISFHFDPLFICRRISEIDRLCGLVVRVSGYSRKGPGFGYRRYQ
jgi:hypothetical protein